MNIIKSLAFLLVFFLPISNTIANDSITKVLNISATIENENFYSYQIEEFRFEQPNLVVEVNNKTGQLVPIQTNLIIKTNVPSSFPAGYQLTAKKMDSECVDVKGNSVISDFANYSIDGEELELDSSVSFDDFFTTQDTLWIKKPFNIDFDDLSEVSLKSNRCKGSAVLIAGLDF